jgi:hypothetical protein
MKKQLHIIQLWLLIVFLEPSKGSKSLFFAEQLLEPLDGSKMQWPTQQNEMIYHPSPVIFQ